ncbi:MAG: succinyldiaminopimelate transaminase [Epsilonproteobacteria bacterium]|nr:succinyldiaminopimelate transaminase [Campylobacterota bacterium]
MKFKKYPFERLNELLADITPNSEYKQINLTIGEPQFPTPSFIKEEVCKNIELLNRYPKSSGEEYLKEAQRDYLRRNFNIELELNEIIPTFGTREVLFNFPQFLLAQKSSPTMAFPNPFYQIYEGAAIASRARVKYLTLTKENSFKPQISSDLKDVDLVILNTPNNPTASALNLEELKRWVEAAKEFDFVLLNDECYIDLYNKEPLPSLLNAAIEAGNRDFKNILVVNSLSKRSSAPGVRSGFIAGDKDILKDYLRYRTYVGAAIPLPLQKGAAAGWMDDNKAAYFREIYNKNLQIAANIFEIPTPKATFYIWLEVKDALKGAKELYKRYNIKVLPGEFLGREGAGKDYWRLALVYEPKIIKEAALRIKKFLGEFYGRD